MAGGRLAWQRDPAADAWVAGGDGCQYRVSRSRCDLDAVLWRAERQLGGRVIYLGEHADPGSARAAAEASAAGAAGIPDPRRAQREKPGARPRSCSGERSRTG